MFQPEHLYTQLSAEWWRASVPGGWIYYAITYPGAGEPCIMSAVFVPDASRAPYEDSRAPRTVHVPITTEPGPQGGPGRR